MSSLNWRVDPSTNEYKAFATHPQTGEEVPVVWAPQPGSQEAFLSCPVYEVCYEGNRGPGKTDALIMDFAQHVGQDKRTQEQIEAGVRKHTGWGAEWRGILFRQTFPQLQDVINKSKKWFPQMWPGAKFNEQKVTWTWPTGETLRFAHIKTKEEYWNYHGHNYPWMGWEEITTWPDDGPYLRMQSCCRSAVSGIPKKIRSTTNPYGVGHNWVKRRFGLPVAPGRIHGDIIRDETTGSGRVAIHGSLHENKILLHADPGYIDRLRSAARNQAELEAWIHGSWDIVAGGMFDDVWNPKIHVIPDLVPDHLPHTWKITRSFDWGSSKPFSVGWWARSDGSTLKLPNGKLMHTVRGDKFRVKEWYGSHAHNNEGLRLLAEDIGKGIIERELEYFPNRRVLPGAADSAIFAEENGVCIANDLSRAVRLPDGRRVRGPQFIPADKRPGSRKVGWEIFRRFLKAAQDPHPRERAGVFVCEGCVDFRRSVPVLPRDEKDLDDVDSDAEDHIADEARYELWASGLEIGYGRISAGTY